MHTFAYFVLTKLRGNNLHLFLTVSAKISFLACCQDGGKNEEKLQVNLSCKGHKISYGIVLMKWSVLNVLSW